jgi:hypothetical protein
MTQRYVEAGMGQLMYELIGWLLDKLLLLLQYLLDGAVYVLKGVLWFFVKGFFDTISAFVNALSFSDTLFQWSAGWAGIPAQMVYILSAIGFPETVALIGAAIALRFSLNLIPGWISRV